MATTKTRAPKVVPADLPAGYRIIRHAGDDISNGHVYYEIEHMDRGEWIGLAWNKMDWQYSPYTLKTHRAGICFLDRSHAITFILGFNWHY